jgi:hypothetical protein
MARMIDNRGYSYYPGDDGGSDFLFSTDIWIEFQRQLTIVDVVMRMLANRYKIDFLSNIRGRWPSRRLRKRKNFKIFEIRLMLNRNYLVNKEIYYELNKYVGIDIFGMFEKKLEFINIKKYSINEINNKDMMLNDLESTISSLLL